MQRILTAIAHPWLCDVMGHLNTRHYVAMFDDTHQVLLGLLGYTEFGSRAHRSGWADVRNEIDYLVEVRGGAVLGIHCGIVRLGGKSIVIASEMRSIDGAVLHARIRAVIVHVDLDERRAIALPEDIHRRAAPFLLGEPPAHQAGHEEEQWEESEHAHHEAAGKAERPARQPWTRGAISGSV